MATLLSRVLGYTINLTTLEVVAMPELGLSSGMPELVAMPELG